MAKLSILIAHKHTPANDAALKLALDMFISNTAADYELLVDTTTPEDPYIVYNRLAAQARADYLLFANSDTFPARGWDTPLLAAANPAYITVPVLVECGAIGIFPGNACANFGMTPETFQRETFEAYAVNNPPFPNGDGWYFPALIHRETFNSTGGFETARGSFMVEPLDSYFWDAWKAAGRYVQKVPSYFYHLQNWSSEVEQVKAVRHAV